MNQNKYSKKIESYILGELQGDELAQFNKELEQNTELKKEVKLYTEINEAITDEGYSHLKKQLESFKTQISANSSVRKPGKVVSLYRNLLVAASVMLICVMSFVAYNNYFDVNSHDDLYSEYYTPYSAEKPLKLLKTRNQEAESYINNMHQGLIAYELKNFTKAIQLLDAASKGQPDIILLHFYLGNSYLSIGDPQKAIIHFEKILQVQDEN